MHEKVMFLTEDCLMTTHQESSLVLPGNFLFIHASILISSGKISLRITIFNHLFPIGHRTTLHVCWTGWVLAYPVSVRPPATRPSSPYQNSRTSSRISLDSTIVSSQVTVCKLAKRTRRLGVMEGSPGLGGCPGPGGWPSVDGQVWAILAAIPGPQLLLSCDIAARTGWPRTP